MRTANDILREMFPDQEALHAKALWECIAFHMSMLADGIEPKAATYIALVLYHSKQNEVAHTSRGLLGAFGL